MTAFLGQIGRRHIDGDPACRQREPGCHQRRPHTLPRFAHRLVGQTDDIESRQPRRDLHLDIDRACLDAFKSDR